MPSLSGKYDPQIGVIVNVAIAPSGGFSQTGSQPTQITTFPGLVDTGASTTCISPTVVNTIGLKSTGKRPMVSANQTKPANIYLVDLVLPFGNAGIIKQGIQVMEFNAMANHPYQLLVGRDILCGGVFTLSFDGHFSFSL